MGWLLTTMAQGLWAAMRGIGFVAKICITYFIKCVRDIRAAIADEWKNRAIDDEIY